MSHVILLANVKFVIGPQTEQLCRITFAFWFEKICRKEIVQRELLQTTLHPGKVQRRNV